MRRLNLNKYLKLVLGKKIFFNNFLCCTNILKIQNEKFYYTLKYPFNLYILGKTMIDENKIVVNALIKFIID